MRTRTGRLAWLLALGLVLAPTRTPAQNYDVPPPQTLLPVPFGGTEDGGFFFAGEVLFYRQTNPIDRQDIAFRGFTDSRTGTFVGSGEAALATDAVAGPVTWQPGLSLTAGWRFRDNSTIDFTWWHLTDARYSAVATTSVKDFAVGPAQQNVFLSSPVFGYPIMYAGPANDFPPNVLPPGTGYGIWNASDEQQITFVQRFDMGGVHWKTPIFSTECWRTTGILGGRAIIMWERFHWRTVDRDFQGFARGIDVAQYSNVVSNRLYGAWVGVGNDWFWGSSPIGGFAGSIDLGGSVMVDFVKQRAKYEIDASPFQGPGLAPVADYPTSSSRAINRYNVSPVFQLDASLWWYPYQGIQCRLGWNMLGIFNTVASPNPVDFNVGAVAPEWERGWTRWLTGIHAGVGFMF